MSNQTGIEWTDTTWNPSTGCSVVSSGCKYCYAETLANRLRLMGNARYENGFDFTIHEDKIEDPLAWRSPRKVFVNSMSDLFHENSTLDFVRDVFAVMQRTPQHQYQVLTKRPERMSTWLTVLQEEGSYTPSTHIWLGTSVENDVVRERIDWLRETPAGVRFLSCEPLIGPLANLNLSDIHWLIAGGESGMHLWKERARSRRGLVDRIDGAWQPVPARVEWVRDLRDQCRRADVAFFFKQWGGPTPKIGGRSLDGRTWDEYPVVVESAPESAVI